MKKIISFSILIIIIVLILCGCHPESTAIYDKVDNSNFIIFKTIKDGFLGDSLQYMYDKDTKIVYMYLQGGYRAGLSPYYIIVNGEPTIAIYGVNYEYQEQDY